MKQKDFFISYSHEDRLWATGLAGWLEDDGFSVVLQAKDFAPGSNFVLAMDKAAGSAERTIAVLSPDYFGSRFTPSEWAAAFSQDPTGRHRRLIPVIVRDCEIRGLLKQIVYINLVDLSMVDAHKRFISGIRFAVTEASPDPDGSVGPTRRPKTSASITQTAVGDGNIQAGGDVYIDRKEVKRTIVTREPGEITDAQARRIKELIDKIVDLLVSAGKSTKSKAYGEWHNRLKQRYRATSYKKIRAEDYEDAVSWLRQHRAMKRPNLRRTNNAAWRNEFYAAIYARWREMGFRKEAIYDFAFERLELRKPIGSLKELGERNLKRLHDIIARMD